MNSSVRKGNQLNLLQVIIETRRSVHYTTKSGKYFIRITLSAQSRNTYKFVQES